MRSGPVPDGISIRAQQAADLPAIQALIEGAWIAGELAGRSRRDIDRWIDRQPGDGESTYLALASDTVVGLLSVTWSSVIVAPAWRRHGIGRALVEAALPEHPDLEMSLPHQNPGAEAFLRATGFRFDHNLQQMRLDPNAVAQPPELPDGYRLRQYEDADFDRYFRLINQSFSDHPTPMQVSEERMRQVHGLPDFDASLIAIVETSAEPRELAAFIFLRTPAVENGVLSGSIGMVGVDPAYRRLGLGRQLLRWGILRLREAACREITLEVVDINERALPLYEQEGFLPVQAWPYWKLAGQ